MDWKALFLSFNGLHVRTIRRFQENILTTSTTVEFLGENIVHNRSIRWWVKFLHFIFITSLGLNLEYDSRNNRHWLTTFAEAQEKNILEHVMVATFVTTKINFFFFLYTYERLFCLVKPAEALATTMENVFFFFLAH